MVVRVECGCNPLQDTRVGHDRSVSTGSGWQGTVSNRQQTVDVSHLVKGRVRRVAKKKGKKKKGKKGKK
jgi:hypothetical protein